MEVLNILIQNSEAFNSKNKFPIDSIRLKELIVRHPEWIDKMSQFAMGARPIIHEDVLELINSFLEMKCQKGSNIEKRIYHQMTVPQFIDRLITKRPLVFMGKSDFHLLRDGQGKGKGGFEKVGVDGQERYPLTMDNYLTYDEIKISALLGTSSHTYSINAGDRYNKGVVSDESTLCRSEEALIVGLVGPRFQKEGVMEHPDIIVSESSKRENDDALYTKLYNISKFPSYQESLQMNDRMIRLRNNSLFDSLVYERRISITVETLLREANHRASLLNKKAYVHVVGLGLGVWKKCPGQEQLYVDVFGRFLSKNSLDNVSDINFSWIPVTNVIGVQNGGSINGVSIHISKRNLFDSLLEDKDKLLVVSWAYDGNSYPGNEFWKGRLSGSGDSQAASCSQVSELHNPQINPWFCGDHLHVISNTFQGVYEYKDFINKV